MSDFLVRPRLDYSTVQQMQKEYEYYVNNGFPSCWNKCGCKHWLCSKCDGRGYICVGLSYYKCSGCNGWMYGHPCDSIRKNIPKNQKKYFMFFYHL